MLVTQTGVIAVLWDSSLARFRPGPLPTKKPLWYLGDLYLVRSFLNPRTVILPILGLEKSFGREFRGVECAVACSFDPFWAWVLVPYWGLPSWPLFGFAWLLACHSNYSR